MPTNHSAATFTWMQDELNRLHDQGLQRRLTPIEDRRPGEICIQGRWLNDFSGNDYLGLTQHPDCIEAAAKALRRYGCGSAGSRIVTGGIPPHEKLESQLQQFTGEPGCLVFPSGYQANLGSISALCQPSDTIYSDADNHASIVDGCRLSGANRRIYPHGRWDILEDWLSEEPQGRRWIITDTVFSMDGTMAPLKRLARLSKDYGAPLLVDEAHAMGVLGKGGRGCCEHHGVRPRLLMGTFSKGLGSHGAFTATDERMAKWLMNRARSFIYTTALPPAVLGSISESMTLSNGDLGDELRKKVLGLAKSLRSNLRGAELDPSGDGTPIVSLPFDEPKQATVIQSRLRDAGHLAWAFRPPTVPAGTSRIRISLSASHNRIQVQELSEALIRLVHQKH
jgi:8-amino-7-oxononanoate synthase